MGGRVDTQAQPGILAVIPAVHDLPTLLPLTLSPSKGPIRPVVRQATTSGATCSEHPNSPVRPQLAGGQPRGSTRHERNEHPL